MLEVLELRGGRPVDKKFNISRPPSLKLHQYHVDRSLVCFNISNLRKPGNWEVTWNNQTMAFSHRADRLPVDSVLIRQIANSGRYFRYRYTEGSKTMRVGEVSPGYCAHIIQPDTCTEQMRELGIGFFTWKLCNMVMSYSVPYVLPDDAYFICGRKAYKWLAPNSEGLCYIGRVMPEVMTITHDKMKDVHRNAQAPYTHTHYEHIVKRHLIDRTEHVASDLIHESTGIQFLLALAITRTARGIINYRYIHALANLIDNITEMYDDTFRYTGRELQAYETELIQHRMVLNYITAVTGGYCVTLATQYGVKCCTYITNSTDDLTEIIDQKMDNILQLKWEFRRRHNLTLTAVSNELTGWVSWLNPRNWFSGLGEWAQNVIMSVGKFLLYILGVVIIIGLIFRCVRILTRRKHSTKLMSLRSGGIVTAADLIYDPSIETMGVIPSCSLASGF
ncbi:syncytin-2-like [Pseudophryne corroboree]|uniref:syncytin-2-like n=1 Tax=Pseudophryne corroboree TaxID=495146 RepID=UPI0030818536